MDMVWLPWMAHGTLALKRQVLFLRKKWSMTSTWEMASSQYMSISMSMNHFMWDQSREWEFVLRPMQISTPNMTGFKRLSSLYRYQSIWGSQGTGFKTGQQVKFGHNSHFASWFVCRNHLPPCGTTLPSTFMQNTETFLWKLSRVLLWCAFKVVKALEVPKCSRLLARRPAMRWVRPLRYLYIKYTMWNVYYTWYTYMYNVYTYVYICCIMWLAGDSKRFVSFRVWGRQGNNEKFHMLRICDFSSPKKLVQVGFHDFPSNVQLGILDQGKENPPSLSLVNLESIRGKSILWKFCQQNSTILKPWNLQGRKKIQDTCDT